MLADQGPRRTCFRYFASKEEIVVFAMDAYGDLIGQAIDEAAGAGRPVDIVRAAVMRVTETVVAQPNARRAMQITDENAGVKAAQLSRLHRIESKVAEEFCRVLGLPHPEHPHAIALAGTTLMLVDATLRAWYRGDDAPLDRIVDALIGGVLLLGVAPTPAGRARRPPHGSSVPARTRSPRSVPNQTR